MQKVFKKGSASLARKNVPGAVGPLKTEENGTIRQPDRWIEHALRAWRHGGGFSRKTLMEIPELFI